MLCRQCSDTTQNKKSLVYCRFLSDEVPTLETFAFTIRIVSTQTFFYFELRIELLNRYKRAKTSEIVASFVDVLWAFIPAHQRLPYGV